MAMAAGAAAAPWPAPSTRCHAQGAAELVFAGKLGHRGQLSCPGAAGGCSAQVQVSTVVLVGKTLKLFSADSHTVCWGTDLRSSVGRVCTAYSDKVRNPPKVSQRLNGWM